MNLGTENIIGAKLGETNISRMYIGSTEVFAPAGYDIFLIAGQSNSYHGEYVSGETIPDEVLDASDPDIFQVGRWDGENNEIILAEEPLDHIGYLGNRPPSNTASWALTFAKMYKAQGYLHGDRKIILVPVGEGGTGFGDNQWNPGDENYEDAVARVAVAMAAGTGTNHIKGILWHQGEDDSNSSDASSYAGNLHAMIDGFRTEFGDQTIPFIAGGMVPAALPTTYGPIVQAALADVVNQRDYTGYADPETPTELTWAGRGPTNHYSVRSARGYPTQDFDDYTTLGLAGRYWVAYLSALNNH